jgi:hypothetical protein
MARRRLLLQNTITLILLGLLAGAVGGIAVGAVTERASSSATTPQRLKNSGC